LDTQNRECIDMKKTKTKKKLLSKTPKINDVHKKIYDKPSEMLE
jgi:hypothetical protein